MNFSRHDQSRQLDKKSSEASSIQHGVQQVDNWSSTVIRSRFQDFKSTTIVGNQRLINADLASEERTLCEAFGCFIRFKRSCTQIGITIAIHQGTAATWRDLCPAKPSKSHETMLECCSTRSSLSLNCIFIVYNLITSCKTQLAVVLPHIDCLYPNAIDGTNSGAFTCCKSTSR